MTDPRRRLTSSALESGDHVAVPYEATLLDQPPLGHVQALLLKAFDGLGPNTSGLSAIELLSVEVGEWAPAQMYGAIKRLEAVGYLKRVGIRKDGRRGPPMKLYDMTDAGRAALRETKKHYRAVADLLERGDVAEARRTGPARAARERPPTISSRPVPKVKILKRGDDGKRPNKEG